MININIAKNKSQFRSGDAHEILEKLWKNEKFPCNKIGEKK